MGLTVARARYPLGHRWGTAGLSAGPRWGTAGLSACPRWGTAGLSACPRWGTAGLFAGNPKPIHRICHRPAASRASKTHFSGLGPPWRSHPCIEGYPQCHRVRAVGMERSDRQHQPIADTQSRFTVYVTGLLPAEPPKRIFLPPRPRGLRPVGGRRLWRPAGALGVLRTAAALPAAWAPILVESSFLFPAQIPLSRPHAVLVAVL